jgi:hypothetical protein
LSKNPKRCQTRWRRALVCKIKSRSIAIAVAWRVVAASISLQAYDEHATHPKSCSDLSFAGKFRTNHDWRASPAVPAKRIPTVMPLSPFSGVKYGRQSVTYCTSPTITSCQQLRTASCHKAPKIKGNKQRWRLIGIYTPIIVQGEAWHVACRRAAPHRTLYPRFKLCKRQTRRRILNADGRTDLIVDQRDPVNAVIWALQPQARGHGHTDHLSGPEKLPLSLLRLAV